MPSDTPFSKPEDHCLDRLCESRAATFGAIIQQLISAQDVERMASDLLALEFHRVAPTLELHKSALLWAERIGQLKVYDAHYLALAENLSAEFWTADKRLFHTL